MIICYKGIYTFITSPKALAKVFMLEIPNFNLAPKL